MSQTLLRQHQSILHGFDPEGRNGDCLRTALGCVMGVDLADVPHFCAPSDDAEKLWWWALVGFAAACGWEATYHPSPDHLLAGWSLLDGRSTHGVCHVVVAYDGEPLWDPNPAGGGLTVVWGAIHLEQVGHR